MTHLAPQIPAQPFAQDQDGSATPLAIGFAVIFIIVGGLAVDFNKAMGERTQLQMAADSAAHAALYTREFESVEDSKDAAFSAIVGMLPTAGFGTTALERADIEFGTWDTSTGQFVIDNASRDAARVFAEMTPRRGNASRNIFLGMAGHDTFAITTSSVYSIYYPPCFNEGFVANDVVDLQSNNSYTNGFCIHSNTYVSLNQNNYFEPGTVVSMPSLDDLDIPSSGFEKNEGLQTALRSGEYRLRLLRQLPLRFQSLRDGEPEYATEAGVTEELPVLWPSIAGNGKNAAYKPISATNTGKKSFDAASFPDKNRIYQANCAGNGDITFAPETFSDFVLVTDCPIKFSNGTILDSVVIATEGDVNASHVQLGLNDNCAPGGGAAIWTYGSVKTASALSGYGAQILALGDVQFTANANGIEGVSFISGGRIDGTSNSDMGFCEGGGTENFQRASYFRMVN
ncbi:MAG: pilus assembly protein TadG-related protein [Roseobacter sp.]